MYHRGKSIRTVEERRAAFWGWIYAPIISKNFMQALTKSQSNTLDITVYDGTEESENSLIFTSKGQGENHSPSPVFTIRKELDVMQRTWTIVWTSTIAFERLKYNNEPFLVMTSGLLFTGLFIIILIILVHRSETVQRLVELKTKEIIASEEQMRLLIQHTPAAVAMFDRNMFYIMTSERWLQDYNLVGHNIIGKSHYDVFPFSHNTSDWIDVYQRAMKGEAINKEEDFWERDDGKKEWVKWALHPWRDALGGIGGIVMFTENITERKEVDRLKSEFISTVSHELRTPLTSIRGSLGLIAGSMADELPKNVNNLIDIAYKNCERLILLINDILDIDKIASGHMTFDMKLENLTVLVQQAVDANRAYGEKYKVTFMFISEDPDIMVNVDAIRLLQVLSNLLSNAAKFSPEGGRVMVRVLSKQELAQVTVQDFGPGISEKFQSQIFSKFSQADSSSSRKKDGTGLGLYISKQLMEHMNGEIGFNTEIGKGTTFWITLPKASK
jgi:PAS domain S-box-containing protein